MTRIEQIEAAIRKEPWKKSQEIADVIQMSVSTVGVTCHKVGTTFAEIRRNRVKELCEKESAQ